MAADHSLKLLLTHNSFEEANRVVSLLRNANYRAESKHVDKLDVLSKLLESKPWDLIIAQFNGQDIPIKSVFTTIRKLNLDVPVILLTDEHSMTEIVEGLRLGAADVVPKPSGATSLDLKEKKGHDITRSARNVLGL